MISQEEEESIPIFPGEKPIDMAKQRRTKTYKYHHVVSRYGRTILIIHMKVVSCGEEKNKSKVDVDSNPQRSVYLCRLANQHSGGGGSMIRNPRSALATYQV